MTMLHRRLAAAAAAAAAPLLLGRLAAAQVQSDCNPMERAGCPPNAAWGTDHLFHFNSTPSSELWQTTVGEVSYDAQRGAAFTINKQGDSPTIRTNFYFFFGRTEVWLKVAPGTGIVSSIMWLSDDLDEIDWEFLGSNKSFATTNFFGKGRKDYHNGGEHPMTGMQDAFHNYTTLWTKDQIDWFIDGANVRTLKAVEANNTDNYPQTPMCMSIGIWAGGDPSLPEGTRHWAGGTTDYKAGPYTMYLQKAHITDFSSGKEYTYSDSSGSWQSIKIADGNSTALQALNREPDKSLGEKWSALPNGAKIAVFSGVATLGALGLGALLFYFIRQRRAGVSEAERADERAETERLEMEHFHDKGLHHDGFADYGHEYDARDLSKGGATSDVDSYHVPEATAASPLAAASSWNGGAAAPSSSSTPPSHHGFDFGVPESPVLPRSRSPLLSQSPGLPPQQPLPTTPTSQGSPAPPPGGSGVYGLPRAQSPSPMGPATSVTENQGGGPAKTGQLL